jgi:hypothetical protein
MQRRKLNRMTKKTRNWLLMFGILAFPFVLFFGFLIFMEPPPVQPLPKPDGHELDKGKPPANFVVPAPTNF